REAMASRLELALFLPQIRRCIEAPGCISFAADRPPGITVIKLAGAPAGSERAERLIASLVLGRQSRAILSRKLKPDSPPLVAIFDEAQLAIRPHDVEHIERLASLSRYLGVSLGFTNQVSEQLPRFLVRLLRTN